MAPTGPEPGPAAGRAQPADLAVPIVAVLAHGAGSTADFVRRAFPAAALGVAAVVALDDRTGSVEVVAEALGAAVGRQLRAGRRVLLGGVSLGAHAAALWAARALRAGPADGSAAVAGGAIGGAAASGPGVVGLVLALPAWTGPPGDVAAATGAAGRDVAAVGVAGVLRRLGADPDLAGDWVLAELASAWPRYGTRTLTVALAAAAASPAPTRADLAALDLPAAVVALRGDPLHPEQVAREWAAALPRAVLAAVDRTAPAADRTVLGRAAGAAWWQATRGSGGVAGNGGADGP